MTNHNRPGKFIVMDGLDGIGKDTLMGGIKKRIEDGGDALTDALGEGTETRPSRILDLHVFWDRMGDHPDFHNINKYSMNLDEFDVIISSEPTYVGTGKFIREEMLPQNGRDYIAPAMANAYALDRLGLFQRVILPALDAGKMVFQSRNHYTSLIYQKIQSQEEDLDTLSVGEILSIPGNDLAHQNCPDVLLIPTIEDMAELERRLKASDRDQDVFENLAFQQTLKTQYESTWFRKFLKDSGTAPIYFDAGGNKPEAIANAVKAYDSAQEQMFVDGFRRRIAQ